jgi:hypothetical protein
MKNALTAFQGEIARIDKVAFWLTTREGLTVEMFPATWAMRCGSVVLLSGYFESFLKDCMRAFITEVNGYSKPIVMLSEMKHVHFRQGAKALEWQLKRDKKAGSTTRCEDLVARLASVGMTTGYTLVWEAFANTQSTPGPDVLSKLLGALGVQGTWKRLKEATPAGLVNLETFLTSFIAMRNECAHSGSTTSPPTATDLLEYGKNLDGLAEAVVNVLTARLVEISEL